MHDKGHAWQGGIHGKGACVVGGCAWQGSVHGRGMCVVGVCGRRACIAGGMHGMEGVHPGEMATEAGGMHPTGMHPCWRC